jgi:hypothetical protein
VEKVKNLAEWMTDRGVDVAELIDLSALDRKVVRAIVEGRYTPSPDQRKRVAAALGIQPGQIAWGHTATVEHLYGHGPQFGRTP